MNKLLNKNNIIKIIISYLISIFFLILIFYLIKKNILNVISLINKVDLKFILAALLLLCLNFYIVSYRFKIILKEFFNDLPTFKLFLITLVGIFINNFFPSSVGGDFVKSIYASNGTGKFLKPIFSVITDRIIGGIGIILFGYIGIYFLPSFKEMQFSFNLLFFVFLLIIIILIMIVFLSRKYNKIELLIEKSSRFKILKIDKILLYMIKIIKSPDLILKGLLLTILTIIIQSLVIWLISKSLNLNINLFYFLFITPVIAMTLFFPSINGLGVREAAYIFLLKDLCSKEAAFSISILNYLLIIFIGLFGGIIIMFRRQLKLSLKFINKNDNNVKNI